MMRSSPLRLAGATWGDRLVASLGALMAIALTGAAFTVASRQGMPLALVTSVGASAVLLFAVPSSPLVQPWSVVGGSVVSAAIGVGVAHLPMPVWLAAGLAVAVAIVAMSLLRCLHPPGGALALAGVLGQGVPHPLALIALNATMLVAFGWLFHRFSGHSYPHRAAATAPPSSAAITDADIDAALDDLDEPFDISREDLRRLVDRVVERAARRQRQKPGVLSREATP